MLTRRNMLGLLGLAPFAAKALANAQPEPPPVILPPKGPPPPVTCNTSTTTAWLYRPVQYRSVSNAELDRCLAHTDSVVAKTMMETDPIWTRGFKR